MPEQEPVAPQEEAQEPELEVAPDVEGLFEPLALDEEDDFEYDDDEAASVVEDDDDELEGDKRGKDYWQKRAEHYEKKARKVDSIEAVDKALSKNGIDSPQVRELLNSMAKKGRPQNQIFETAKIARQIINQERKQLKSQLEKHYGSLDAFKEQTINSAEQEAAARFGPADMGASAPTGQVEWDSIKDLSFEEQVSHADRLKPRSKGFPSR